MKGWLGAPPVEFVSPNSRSQTRPLVQSGVVGAVAGSSAVGSARERSRSPSRGALPGLHRGAPGRLDRQLAGLPAVLSFDDRRLALEALDRDILAESTHRSNEARLRTVENALRLWGIPMWPPTAASWKALAATLKPGATLQPRCIFQLIEWQLSAEAICWTSWL